MNKLVSVDLCADFGCLKKPDTNDPVYLTFNMLYKPALLGIFGAIIGLEGFQEPATKAKMRKNKNSSFEQGEQRSVAPYYEMLKDLKIGIQPLRDENGNFSKTLVTYNNGVGYANVQSKVPGNLMITEQILIAPAYRCFILFEQEDAVFTQLFKNLKAKDAVYLPYLGKNEFSVWWTNWKEYCHRKYEPGEEAFQIRSIFIKEIPVKEGEVWQAFKPDSIPDFMYFENLPISYGNEPIQYRYAAFAYTNSQLKRDYPVADLYQLVDNKPNEIIQLF